MELERPSPMPVLPEWDLGIVLEALAKPPYNPLREASLKHLTYKWSSAMALAGRRSELHGLVIDSKYIQFKPQAWALRSTSAMNSCIRIKRLPKLMTPGLYQRSLLGSLSLAILTALSQLFVLSYGRNLEIGRFMAETSRAA